MLVFFVVHRTLTYGTIQRHRASGAVLDTYTAWIAATLEVLPTLKELFGTLVIPQAVIDDLIMFKGLEKPSGKTFSIAYHDGQFLKHEVTRDQALQRQKYVEEQKSKIEKYCQIIAIEAPEIIGQDARERIECLDFALDNFGSGVLDPAAVAATGYILLSEDMNYRKIANAVWPVGSAWLQPALATAVDGGIISFDEYGKKLVALAKLRHGFITIDHMILLEVLGSGDEIAMEGFKAAADFIGTPAADLGSHVGVVIPFIDAVLEKKALPDVVRLKAISILLSNLVRKRSDLYPKILVGVIIGCDKPGQAVVARWAQGHFMVPQVEQAYREYLQVTRSRVIRRIIQSDDSLVGNVQRLLSLRRPPKLPPSFAG